MTKTKLQIMREKNEELLRANINMHDALDLKSERIQELKKQLATAVEALEKISEVQNLTPFKKEFETSKALGKARDMRNTAKQALAEIGGEDE